MSAVISSPGCRTRRTWLAPLISGLVTLGFAWPAQAQNWTASVSAATDRVYHGISQSDGRPSYSLDASLVGPDGWSGSFGLAAPAYRSRGGSTELTLTGAKGWQIDSQWNAQATATRYAYTGSGLVRALDRTELMMSTGWRSRALLSLAFSPDTYSYRLGQARRGSALTAELAYRQPLPGQLALDLGVGYQDLRTAGHTGYPYGSVGLGWGLGPALLSLTWIDSRALERQVAYGNSAGRRWVASVVWTWRG